MEAERVSCVHAEHSFAAVWSRGSQSAVPAPEALARSKSSDLARFWGRGPPGDAEAYLGLGTTGGEYLSEVDW